MRNLKELYTILLEEDLSLGICIAIELLSISNIITFEECGYLQNHFIKQKPTIFSKFWWDRSFTIIGAINNSWWWRRNSRGNQQRKLFLQSIVDSL